MNKKTVALLMACVLLVGTAIGGTMAWLIDSTGEVTNTFTVGDINIELSETTGIAQQDGKKDYPFVPGDTLSKDPKVTVEADSEPCWLFVKIEESGNTNITGLDGKVINYSVNSAWTQVPNTTDVWYINITDKTIQDTDYPVLTDNQVTVNENVTKTMADNILDTEKPVLTFTAYAIQSANLKDAEGNVADVADAWDLVKPVPAPTNP